MGSKEAPHGVKCQGLSEQNELLRAPSGLTLNVSGDEAPTTSLGNMFQCFTSSALLFVADSYERMTNPLYFWPLPFS